MTTPANKVTVALLSDEEIPASFQLVSKSFSHDAPFIDNLFPGHDTPSGQVQGSKRFALWKQSSKTSTFLKAVKQADQEGENQIIGFAVWTYLKEAQPRKLEEVENVEEVWPDKANREFMARLWSEFMQPRSQVIRDLHGQGVYVLELLAVHPEYQRYGAGTALVKWGTKAADELGVKAIVEGTQVGRHLYEKCGFHVEIEEMRFDVGEEFAGRRKPKLTFLTREPES